MKNLEIIKTIQKRFVDRHITLSLAESCTGGTLISQLTSLPGASQYISGGVIAYSNKIKINELNVSRATLLASGAVSQVVAVQMAKGLRKKLESTWSLGITGIAGPSGGTVTKPVGTVCIAVCGPGFEYVATYCFKGARLEIIEASVNKALELLLTATQ
ncbi:MAG: CinA family protein [Pseudomonadota bacterium]|nr:CinA family protein [Pseudomonadota bacterium]